MELIFRRGSIRIGVASFDVEGVGFAVSQYPLEETVLPLSPILVRFLGQS